MINNLSLFICIFAFVKKEFISIFLLISFLGVIFHELIPHHHHDFEEIEFFSHHIPLNEDQDGDSHDHNERDLSFPYHQHLSATDSIDIVCKSSNTINCITIPVSCLPPGDLLSCLQEPDPPGQVLYFSFVIHITSHVFDTPNLLRGSPSVA